MKILRTEANLDENQIKDILLIKYPNLKNISFFVRKDEITATAKIKNDDKFKSTTTVFFTFQDLKELIYNHLQTEGIVVKDYSIRDTSDSSSYTDFFYTVFYDKNENFN